MPDMKRISPGFEVREGCAGEVAAALAKAIDSAMSRYSADDDLSVIGQPLDWCTPIRDELIKLSQTLRKPFGVTHAEWLFELSKTQPQ